MRFACNSSCELALRATASLSLSILTPIPHWQIRHLTQSKLALPDADRTPGEQELSLYGALKIIIAEQARWRALTGAPAARECPCGSIKKGCGRTSRSSKEWEQVR